ncbi:hypothetical protein B0H19DRAFT_1112676 [Mycena capillaripes]|nr:hypothetical protein B0H19DRAFT_1112676 [Mycena capillaripes]
MHCMPFAIAELAKLYSQIVICSPILVLRCVVRRTGRRQRQGCVRELLVLPYPSPLPTDRIDIGRNQPATEQDQPLSCRLLHLPPELCRLIFEVAVGNRLVHLKMVPNNLLIPVDQIPVALLLTCRSVYPEVLPIRQNTFYFHLKDFQPAIQRLGTVLSVGAYIFITAMYLCIPTNPYGIPRSAHCSTWISTVLRSNLRYWSGPRGIRATFLWIAPGAGVI